MSFRIPQNLDELAAALREKDENTYLCAGGTDLVIHLRKEKKFHYSLIDLTHLPELSQITETEDSVIIGAGVTMTELEQCPLVRTWIPALSKAASMVGSTQIRNRATLGGNVANASQSSDTTPVLLAYGAEAEILDGTGAVTKRLVDDFVEGLEKTTLGEREVILKFIVKKQHVLSAFAKVGARKAVTISKINGCICTEIKEGCMMHPVVYLGAVGAKAGRARLIEACLEGQTLSGCDEEKIRDAVYAQIEENIPNRPSKHYKKSAAFGVIDQILDDLRRAEEEAGR
nr:FAD binding domain-containing protein [uncultured Blautia sp.]